MALGLAFSRAADFAGLRCGTSRRYPGVALGLAFCRPADLALLRRGAGRCLPRMAFCLAFSRPADFAGLRRGTGRCLPGMAFCLAFRRSADLARLRGCACRRLPRMALGCAFRRSADLALLRRGTGRRLPGMPAGGRNDAAGPDSASAAQAVNVPAVTFCGTGGLPGVPGFRAAGMVFRIDGDDLVLLRAAAGAGIMGQAHFGAGRGIENDALIPGMARRIHRVHPVLYGAADGARKAREP